MALASLPVELPNFLSPLVADRTLSPSGDSDTLVSPQSLRTWSLLVIAAFSPPDIVVASMRGDNGGVPRREAPGEPDPGHTVVPELAW